MSITVFGIEISTGGDKVSLVIKHKDSTTNVRTRNIIRLPIGFLGLSLFFSPWIKFPHTLIMMVIIKRIISIREMPMVRLIRMGSRVPQVSGGEESVLVLFILQIEYNTG